MSDSPNPYAIPQSNLTLGAQEEYGEIRLFSSQGRIGRLRYMAYSFSLIYGSLLIAALLVFVFPHALDSTGFTLNILVVIISVIVIACMCVPMFLSIQRLHDLNYSGWFMLLYCIPLLNLALMLGLLFAPGNIERNKYGAPPPPNSLLVKIIALFPLMVMLIGILMPVLQKLVFLKLP